MGIRRLGLVALVVVAAGACGAHPDVPVASSYVPVPTVVAAPETVPVAAVAAAPPAVAGTGVWAVVVGIDDYPGNADLANAVGDADTVVAALDLAGVPASQRIVLRDGAATAPAIGDALRWLVANAGPSATAVFAYAGHAELLETGSQAIVAADGTRMLDTELAGLLAPLQAGSSWLLFASCYGGGFDELLAPGRILTAGAAPDGIAYELSRLGRSFLVEYLVERAWLEGRSGSSVQEAAAFATAAIGQESPANLPWIVDWTSAPIVLGPVGAPYVVPPAEPVVVTVPPPVDTVPVAPPPRPTAGNRTCRQVGAVRLCD